MKHARVGGRAEAYHLALVAYCVGDAVRSSSDRPDVVHDPSRLVHSADCVPEPAYGAALPGCPRRTTAARLINIRRLLLRTSAGST